MGENLTNYLIGFRCLVRLPYTTGPMNCSEQEIRQRFLLKVRGHNAKTECELRPTKDLSNLEELAKIVDQSHGEYERGKFYLRARGETRCRVWNDGFSSTGNMSEALSLVLTART